MQEAADMNTIADYMKWRGDLTLEQSPFNEVDAAILARFSYEPFDGVVPENLREWKNIGKVCNELLNNPSLNDEIISQTHDVSFIVSLMNSVRFKNMQISGYVNEFDIDKQLQFSACLIDLDGEQNYFVAFRGTDNTIIGWKEDFNMGFEFPVPAQERALSYLESVISAYKDGTFIVGGHSKGGNLAVYSATFCDDRFNAPIKDIYNFDGPGFTEKIMQTDEFRKIAKNIHTFIPEFSVVGMLLEHLEDYTVVHSDQTGFLQHEILTWEVEGPGFIHKEEVSAGSKIIDQAFKDWLSGLSKEEREQFVDTAFNIMMSSDAVTLAEFSSKKKENINLMIRTFNNMDGEIRKNFLDTAKRFLGSAGNAFKSGQEGQ